MKDPQMRPTQSNVELASEHMELPGENTAGPTNLAVSRTSAFQSMSTNPPLAPDLATIVASVAAAAGLPPQPQPADLAQLLLLQAGILGMPGMSNGLALNTAQLAGQLAAQAPQRPLMPTPTTLAPPPPPASAPVPTTATTSGGAGGYNNNNAINNKSRQTRSADGRTNVTASYASRHQQAEARRRSRINERLDALRRIVPHSERANTALFLEDVVRYVQRLQHRVVELETKLGLPHSVHPLATPITFGENPATPEVTPAGNVANMSALQIPNPNTNPTTVMLQAMLQQQQQQQHQMAVAVAAAAAANAAATMHHGNRHGNDHGSGGNGGERQQQEGLVLMPSMSEELAMAAQLAPGKRDDGATNKAMTAENQPMIEGGGDEDEEVEGGMKKRPREGEDEERVDRGVEHENKKIKNEDE